MEPTRLNKYLVDAGVCSRREADRLMGEGRITVNGRRAVLGQKVTGVEKILVDRKAVKPPASVERVYLAYHKPIGIICSSDPKAKDNIIDAVHYPGSRVFHIGRLDVASSGLILLTNDGAVVNAILRAEGKHDKEYEVSVLKPISEVDLDKLRHGVEILGRKTLPAKVKRIDERTFSITIVEGRNRQIRRMCEAVNHDVQRLKRVRVMNVELGDLPVN
ncbi:MAG: rRNA pseudouridine synthase, partial [Candidatus Uhrbacteria bacterium]|nr:rRNA pseudouridine synthase [Candidatus Uhrbacteria bacterium]